jgi:A/G-specific adenine glycosylase
MPTNLTLVRRSLLRWYGRNHRALPWRRTRDPYAIWIAETMLQQTQVATVLPYYSRFLETFPRPRDLAAASRQEVLAVWSGLGYYRRAENLHRAARLLMREHRAAVPRDYDALRSLPGIGPYTAGALMSIAFGQPCPAVDGNARRVLARVFDARREKDISSIAQKLAAGPRPGQWNQALMELGAKVCRAQKPNCPSCPLTRSCRARRSGRLRTAGPRVPKPRPTAVDWPMVLLYRNNKILLRRRPENGLLGGLWEPPGGQRKKGESRAAVLRRHLDGLVARDAVISRIGEVRHGITNHRILAPIYRASIVEEIRRPPAGCRWVALSSLGRYPVSSLTLKAIKLLGRP